MSDLDSKITQIVLGIGGSALLIYLMSKQLKGTVRVAPLPSDVPPHRTPLSLKTEIHMDSKDSQYQNGNSKEPVDKSLKKYESSFISYIYQKGVRLSPVQKELFDETNRQFPSSCIMMGGRQVGALLNNLIRLSFAKKGIEIGVYTGFTSLGMALALPDDGQLLAMDINQEYTSFGEQYWKKANVRHKIHLILKSAVIALDELIKDVSNHGTFDFAFVDADKVGYDTYYEKLLILLKPGAWILFDNMLAHGFIVSKNVPESEKASVEAIRALNEKLYRDTRVEISLLEVCDGVNLVVKK